LFSGIKPLSACFFNLIFPDDCRLCEQPLRNVSRIPVCLSCLQGPKPLQAEFFCRSCRTAFVSSFSLDAEGLCAVCRENLVNFDAAYSFGAYEGELRKLIHLFKYGKVESLADPLSRFLLQAIPLEAQFDLVIAMPMHWRKQWERGFNQARLLAEPVAKRYGLPLTGRHLRRTRYTKPQAGLNEAQRRNNLKNSFRVNRQEQVAGQRVLLIDDVFTTGATLRAAAEVLKAAGALHVSALTLARVDHHAPETDAHSLGALHRLTSFAPSRKNTKDEVSAGTGVQ
jgi:ComF family protein